MAGNRSAAAKKAWLTRRGALSAAARAGRKKPLMTAKAWDKAARAGAVLVNGRPISEVFPNAFRAQFKRVSPLARGNAFLAQKRLGRLAMHSYKKGSRGRR